MFFIPARKGRAEAEQGSQGGVAEGDDAADSCAGDGEHDDAVRLVGAVAGRGGSRPPRAARWRWWAACASRRVRPGSSAQEGHAGRAAGEPGPQRRRLHGGVVRAAAVCSAAASAFSNAAMYWSRSARARGSAGSATSSAAGASSAQPGAGALQGALDRGRRRCRACPRPRRPGRPARPGGSAPPAAGPAGTAGWR